MKKRLLSLFILFFTMMIAGHVMAQTHHSDTTFANSGKYSVSVSPNPFEDEVTISITQGNKNLTAIRISDLIGKDVVYIDLRNKPNSITFKLDVSQLRTGVYFCNIYGDGGVVETKKLFRTK